MDTKLEPQRGRTYLELRGTSCTLTMVARPSYCDRGRVQVMVDVDPGSREPWIDGADGFPRYYFDVDRAKAEMHDWLLARKQWVGDAWQEVVIE